MFCFIIFRSIFQDIISMDTVIMKIMVRQAPGQGRILKYSTNRDVPSHIQEHGCLHFKSIEHGGTCLCYKLMFSHYYTHVSIFRFIRNFRKIGVACYFWMALYSNMQL